MFAYFSFVYFVQYFQINRTTLWHKTNTFTRGSPEVTQVILNSETKRRTVKLSGIFKLLSGTAKKIWLCSCEFTAPAKALQFAKPKIFPARSFFKINKRGSSHMVLLSQGCRVGVAGLVTLLPQDADCLWAAALLWSSNAVAVAMLMAAPGYIAPWPLPALFLCSSG